MITLMAVTMICICIIAVTYWVFVRSYNNRAIAEIDRLRIENDRLTSEVIDLNGQIGYLQGKATSEWEDVVPEEYTIPGLNETMAALDNLTLKKGSGTK